MDIFPEITEVPIHIYSGKNQNQNRTKQKNIPSELT